jgi:hypothetical protein
MVGRQVYINLFSNICRLCNGKVRCGQFNERGDIYRVLLPAEYPVICGL